jgi:AraC-like DNA-binding protein
LFKNMREDDHEWLEIHYFSPSDFEKSGPAWPIRLGSNIAKPHYRIGPIVSPYYYLVMVLDGAGVFHQGGRTFTLRKNDLFGLFPQNRHEYYTLPDKPLRKAFFAFDGPGALHLLERVGLTPANPHLPGRVTPDAIASMERFFKLVGDGEAPHSDLSRLASFYRVFDSLSERRQASEAYRTTGEWLQKGKDYIDIHYADGITVESAADHAGMSRSHFSKQFAKTFGSPPVQYLQKLRMAEAARLLQQTDYKLAEIAQSVGYPDLFSFSKAFKKQLGLPPAQYRRQPSEYSPD